MVDDQPTADDASRSKPDPDILVAALAVYDDAADLLAHFDASRFGTPVREESPARPRRGYR